jgi:Bucentaur or craniofacial development
MNDEEFDNELSEDDSDFDPEKETVESLSENSGAEADDPVNSDDDEDKTKKTKKRKKVSRGRRGKPVEPEVEEEPVAKAVDPEEEKRKADALWADFLSGTDTPVEPKKDDIKAKPATSTSAAASSKPDTTTTIIPKAPQPKQIFEFAGETVEIQTKSTEQQSPSNAAPKLPAAGVKRASTGGGLSSILGQLNKKNKLSVLEKTKLDWDGFKDNEGISEELQTHNRGRDG